MKILFKILSQLLLIWIKLMMYDLHSQTSPPPLPILASDQLYRRLSRKSNRKWMSTFLRIVSCQMIQTLNGINKLTFSLPKRTVIGMKRKMIRASVCDICLWLASLLRQEGSWFGKDALCDDWTTACSTVNKSVIPMQSFFQTFPSSLRGGLTISLFFHLKKNRVRLLER